MTSEQLAIVVPSVTAVLVLAGNLWYQWRLTQRTLQHEAEFALKRLNHERAIARDERIQERISAVYDELLLYLSVRLAAPKRYDPDNLETSELPESDPKEGHRVRMRTAGHGSPDVLGILDRWANGETRYLDHLTQLAQVLKEAQEADAREDESSPEKLAELEKHLAAVEQADQDMTQAFVDLGHQVNRELRT